MRYSEEVSRLIRDAAQQAKQLGHSYVGSAHILLSLAEDPDLPGQLLREAGADRQMLRNIAVVLYGKGTPWMPLPQSFSEQARQIMTKAGTEAKLLASREVERIHILLALLRCPRSAAGDMLKLSGVDREEFFTGVVDYLRWEATNPVKRKKEAVYMRLLEQFSEDLIQKAATMILYGTPRREKACSTALDWAFMR